MDCLHETVMMGSCINCNCPITINDIPNQYYTKTLNLNKYSFNPRIKNKAQEIFKTRMSVSLKKGSRVKELVAFLICAAYKELDEPFDMSEITMQVLGTKRVPSKIFSSFSYIKTNYKPPIRIGEPSVYIQKYCAHAAIIPLKIIDDILACFEQVNKDIPLLLDQSPQKIASAFIQCYLEESNFIIDGNDRFNLCKLSSVTQGTISTVIKQIRPFVIDYVAKTK